MFSVVATLAVISFCNPFAESVRACDNCNHCGLDCGVEENVAAPVVALTYPEPYNGEETKKGGLTIQIRPVPPRPAPPRPAPYWPRWVPVRPAPPPRPIGPPPPRW